MIAFVLPTRDRPEELARTLTALGGLRLRGAADVIVVDNASGVAAVVPARLANGMAARAVRLAENLGAAARNVGVREAGAVEGRACEWVIMLDDDSAPTDARFEDVLARQPEDVAAVMADIVLPDGSRERGGLPEVFIGCGVAIRRRVFEALGGYDAAFGYYAEEYDLAARMLMAGQRVVFEPEFGVLHRKVAGQRDLGVILGRLVRNNGWVMQRYAPEWELAERLRENEERYRAIAAKEGVTPGYERGRAELRATIGQQRRTPMGEGVWRRFTGEAAAEAAIGAQVEKHARGPGERGPMPVCVVERGKNDWAIDRVLARLGERGVVRVTEDWHAARAVVIGTLSPGPMLDAAAAWRERLGGRGTAVITPWAGAVAAGASAGQGDAARCAARGP